MNAPAFDRVETTVVEPAQRRPLNMPMSLEMLLDECVGARVSLAPPMKPMTSKI